MKVYPAKAHTNVQLSPITVHNPEKEHNGLKDSIRSSMGRKKPMPQRKKKNGKWEKSLVFTGMSRGMIPR